MPSIKKFVAHASVELSADFFRRNGVELTADEWSDPASAVVAHIHSRMADTPFGTASQIDQQIERIERMATEAGENAIEDTTIHDNLASLQSRTARALWVFLHDPQGFRRAEEILFHDAQRYGRQWTVFSGEKGRDLQTDPAAQNAFKEALKALFDTPNVHLDIFERSRPKFDDSSGDGAEEAKVELVQVTIYREARPTVEPTFVDSTLTYQTRSPVIEAAVTYEPASGRIECVASQRANRADVAHHFAKTMLGSSSDMEPCIQKSYDLSVLLDPIEFDTDDGDRIAAVGVTMLKLQPVDASPERITIDRHAESERSIWQVADDRLGKDSLSRDYQIRQAQIAIKWRAEGENRLRTLRVGITHPYKSDIKEKSEIERVVAAKYLPRWGLVVGQ